MLAFWQKRTIFEKSIAQREGGRSSSSTTARRSPPACRTSATSFPSTIKDVIPRYQTMKGSKVERRFGWDCHGLPVEYEMEKELGISGKRQIEEYGVAKFNEACRSIVLRYTREWRKVITRLGRWVDFDNDYKTMDPDYMESIWWVVSELWKKGLLYEGYYILPVLPPLLHGALQLRAEPRRLRRRRGPGDHGEVRRGRRAATRTSWRGPPRPGPCRPTSGWPSARTSTT